MASTTSVSKQVLFGSRVSGASGLGQYATGSDLNNIQRYSRALATDFLMGGLARSSERSVVWGLNVYCGGNGGHMYPHAVTVRGLRFAAGTIYVPSSTTVTGDDQVFLEYRLADDELACTFAANASGSDRWDIVQVRLTATNGNSTTQGLNAAVTQTGNNDMRSQADASVPPIASSQDFNVVRSNVLAFSIKQGTPGSGTEPTADAGYLKIAAVLITNGMATTIPVGSIRDYRIPLGLRLVVVQGNQSNYSPGYFIADASGQVYGDGNATPRIAKALPTGSPWESGRLMACGAITISLGAGTALDLIRTNPATPATADVVVQACTASMIYPTGGALFRQLDLSTLPPIWMDGTWAASAQTYQAVLNGGTSQIETATMNRLGMRFTTGVSQADSFFSAWFWIAGM